jgi:hypothetical protein
MDHCSKPVKGAAFGVGSYISLKFRALDLDFGQVNTGFMGPLHRAINLIVALTLVALGCAGAVYFYFIATIWNRGLAVGAGIVAVAGLYWLWDEYVHKWHASEN